jgi:hypothetical protein
MWTHGSIYAAHDERPHLRQNRADAYCDWMDLRAAYRVMANNYDNVNIELVRRSKAVIEQASKNKLTHYLDKRFLPGPHGFFPDKGFFSD